MMLVCYTIFRRINIVDKVFYNRMIRKGLFLTNRYTKLNLILAARISTKEEFLSKLASKKYREILGLHESRQDLFKDKDLHRAYLNQIKKFHSDNVQSEERKKEFQEITKCIIAAYDELKKEDENYKESSKNEKVIFHDQEQVAQQLFGKGYNEIKYNMYAPGNQDMRAKFLQQLEKKKQSTRTSQPKPEPTASQPRPAQYYAQTASTSHSDGSLAKFIALIVACGLLSIPLFKKDSKKSESSEPKKENKVREYTQKEYDVMELNSKKILMKPLERFYNIILKRRPHMLIYPNDKDPHILEQLAKYSIASDIHLYEVPSKYFLNEKDNNELKAANATDKVQKYELTETKPNTLLTLSLEAERALHNVYVSADDVLSEIKETGKFTPPKIFFKFHGYIMFQLRPKPFSTLQCYRNTRYISLFDLYFDYYSPIFFKRDHYREYLAGFEEDEPFKNNRYFGNVYINHRKIPKVYLQKGQKVVIMRDVKKAYEPSGLLKKTEDTYRADWQGYYARFEKNWKKYCAHQSQGTIHY